MKRVSEIQINEKIVKLRRVITSRHISTYAKKLTNTNRDCPIIISGFTGEGKSVLGVHIARHFDKKYTHERNLIYSRDEFRNKVNEFPPSALNVDENMNVLYKRDWGTKGQKEIIKLLDICRFKRHLIIFIQPTMTAVDSHVRDNRVRMWILVIKRGLAAVFRPIRSLTAEDPWRLKDNEATIKKHIKSSGDEIEGRIEGCFNCENFLCFLRWEDMEQEDYKIYEDVKDRKKEAYEEIKLYTLEEARKLGNEKIFNIFAILKENKKLKQGSYDFIAAEMDMSKGAISAHLKKAQIRKGLTEVQKFKEQIKAPKEEYLT